MNQEYLHNKAECLVTFESGRTQKLLFLTPDRSQESTLKLRLEDLFIEEGAFNSLGSSINLLCYNLLNPRGLGVYRD